jgi:hypothetical protein
MSPILEFPFLRLAIASLALLAIATLLASISCFLITSTAYSLSSSGKWLKSSIILLNISFFVYYSTCLKITYHYFTTPKVLLSFHYF